MEILPIAVIRTEFPEKFGIPRQSGLASSLRGRIVFNEGYKDPSALRGLESFSHLWLIWEFSSNRHSDWHPTVRPPRLGGNATMGVFATRSPFRPNPLGLSCVELDRIEYSTAEGPIIYVRGADLMDGTPIYDIKPYIRYADSRPDAVCGYADEIPQKTLEVVMSEAVRMELGDKAEAAVEILAYDPRPSYQNDPERVYGLSYAGYDIKFVVVDNTLTVTELIMI
jgi:tRNA-Thr(GGU) m(6)t(6)A37 methyltransferase TsaA